MTGTVQALGSAAGGAVCEGRRYPRYKHSGVEWLGEVPEHWEVKSIGRMGPLFRGQGGSKEDEVAEGLPCVRYGDLYTRHEFFIESTKACVTPARAPAYTEIQRGDVLFAASGETVDDIGRSAVNLMDAPACCGGDVLVLRPQSDVVDKFLGYAADCVASRRQKASMGRGFTVVHLYASHLKRLQLAMPPVDEQERIVRFLDHASQRIRRYIRAKQKLIRLLEEQKQATIHRAVTRGLDPDVRLKPSGVEWLGDVPAHWELTRLKDIADVQTGLTLGKSYLGKRTESRPYLRVANVQAGRLDLRNVKRMDVPEGEAVRSTLRAGDVLMTEGGDIDKLGRGCVWQDEIPDCLHQNHIFAVRCQRNRLDPEFLVALQASGHGRSYFELTAKQTTNLAATNSTTLRAFPILLPPLSEQQAILVATRAQAAKLESGIRCAHREVVLFEEFLTRLVADVVAGKLDVREAASRLPAVPEDTGDIHDSGEEAEVRDTELDLVDELVENPE